MRALNLKTGIAAAIVLFLSTSQAAAQHTSMVWFGNSYSEAGRIYNGVPTMINGSFGITENLTIDSLNPKIYPSCWLDCHETTWPAFTLIDSGHYTYVVAQGNHPSTTAGAANQLTTWANHAKGAGGILVIEEMWMNIKSGQTQTDQDRINGWFDSLARVTNSILIPNGYAWWIARQANPGLEFIDPNWNDGGHPGRFGAYLNQCAFYAALTGVSPVGLTYKKTSFGSDFTLSDADALFAQQKAWEAYQYFFPPDRPVISGFTANPAAAVAGVQTSVTFTATVTGTNPITSVVLDLGSVGGSSSVTLAGSGNTYSHTFSIPGSVALGPKTVSLRATDNAGNYQIARFRYNIERPLALKEARASYNNTKVTVDFSERLNQTTAGNIANYSINNGVTISSAAVGPDSNIVVLSTSALLTNTTYRLTVSNVSDDAGSIVTASSQDTFQFFTGGDGINGTYWQNQTLSGTPLATQIDPNVDFPMGFSCPQLWSNDWIGVRWDGQLQIPYSGTYTFYIQASHGARMYLNNVLVVDGWAGGDTLVTGNTTIGKGVYTFKMEYGSTQGTKFCSLFWSSNTKISKREVVPHQFFFTGAPLQVSPLAAPMIKSGAVSSYLVKRIDLRGRIVSSFVTSDPEKIGVRSSGVYFLEIKDMKSGTTIKRSCLVR